jgi:hypothetical protein
LRLFWAPASPRLLLPDLGDLLHHLVVNVGVGHDLTTTAIRVAENHLHRLLLIWDFLLRKVTDEDRFSRHVYSLQLSGFPALPQPFAARSATAIRNDFAHDRACHAGRFSVGVGLV